MRVTADIIARSLHVPVVQADVTVLVALVAYQRYRLLGLRLMQLIGQHSREYGLLVIIKATSVQ